MIEMTKALYDKHTILPYTCVIELILGIHVSSYE